MTEAAIIYLRISQDRTGERAGVERQREDCERRCRERGWTVVAVEVDNDVSAKSGKRRPGFEAVIGAVEGKRADVVVAWSLDRLQRNRRDELRLYEACTEAGASLSLINGADLDFSTAAGRFVADSLGSVARMEVEMKSDRQRRASDQAAHEGRRVGGRRPFGYDDDGMTVRDDEATAIRDAYRSLLSGISLAAIARSWNAAGLRSGQTRWSEKRKGEPSQWDRSTVRQVMLNPRNAGKRAHRGQIVADAVWPAIVDEPTWRAVVDLLTHPERRRVPVRGKALLTGLAECAVCGSTVNTGGTTTGAPSYRCSGSYGHVGRAAAPIEAYVLEWVAARLSRVDARELFVDETKPDVDALRTEATALRARLDSLAGLFATGELTMSQLQTGTRAMRDRLATVEAEMSDAGRVDLLGPLIASSDVAATLHEMETTAVRAVIGALCGVIIRPAGRGVRTLRPDAVLIVPTRSEENPFV